MQLTDRVTVVTGSGRGIGRTIAREFGREGARVICCARSEDEINETAKLIEREGGEATAMRLDVTQKSKVREVIDRVLEEYGRIDVLFNNAGSFRTIGGVWEIDPDSWWHDVTVNLRGPMLCSRAVLPHMMDRNEGIIVNMSGGGFDRPFPGGSGYACSKAALMRFTDSLARELERVESRVLVLGMGPGLVRTRMTEYQVETTEGREWIPFVAERFDKGDHRPPEDCARATVKLINLACPELNGRIFDVETDFEEVKRRLKEIQEKDLFVLRFRT